MAISLPLNPTPAWCVFVCVLFMHVHAGHAGLHEMAYVHAHWNNALVIRASALARVWMRT